MTGSDSDLLIYNRLLREATGLSSVDNENKETSPNSTTLAASDIKANATNEDELVETSELTDDTNDNASVEDDSDIVDKNSNTDEQVEDNAKSDDETLEETKPAENEGEVADNEATDDNKEQEINLDEFKKLISVNKKMDELIKDVGYDKVFELFDKDGDGKISKEEIKKLSSSSDTIDDITYAEMKKILKENIKEEEENSIEDEKSFNNLLEKLKEALGIEDNQTQQAETTPIQQTPSYS